MTQVGLKNIYVAKLTETGEVVTYETPRKIGHAITANVTPNVETAVLHADDRAIESEETLADIDIELNVSDLSVEDYSFLLGANIDENGGVTDSINNVAPYVALGFEVSLTKGGKRMYWYYKGKFGIPSSEHTTKQGTTAYQTPSISAKFLPRADGKWRYRLDETETNKGIVNNWFAEVQEEPTGE